MDAAIVLLALVGVAGASLRWGHESRPSFDPAGYDGVRDRIEGLLYEARVDGVARRASPSRRRQAAATVGVWLVGAGQRLQSYGESLVMPSRLAATSDGSIQSGL